MQDKDMRVEYLKGESVLPIISPREQSIQLVSWARDNREAILQLLLEYGGILFRGFRVTEMDQLQQFVSSVSSNLLEYGERSSPRTQVGDRIYTSTDYPADQSIFLHNENSYQSTWPQKIFFWCVKPADTGGETPIADTRWIFNALDASIREKFVSKHILYVRNIGGGIGLSWQDVFQTNDKQVVEAYCAQSGIQVEWRQGDILRTRQVRPAVSLHPVTKEPLWFNHATFFHVSTLPPLFQEVLLAEFENEENLPNNTYFGDGTVIERSILDHLRDVYLRAQIMFPWEKGDVLMLDNMMVAHGRQPFTGSRKVLVAMSEPFSGPALGKV